VLILVKHSLPAIDPYVPPAHWHLTAEGEARCQALAERLRAYEPAALLSSPEPKAARTAKLVAPQLGLTVEFDPRLREQYRPYLEWLPNEIFQWIIGGAFERPDEIVHGMERLSSARERFAAAIDERLERTAEPLVAVAHGTVISAYVESKAAVDGFALWRRLGLPSFVVVDGNELVDVVDGV
jgi:broad specificity phosphatase PhoE